MPIVDDDGALAGVMTERTLARRYIRESREATSLADAAASVRAIVEVTEGRLVAGEEREIDGRVWVLAMAVESLPGGHPRGRRRRGRRPPRRPAARGRDRRRAARHQQRDGALGRDPGPRPRARHRRGVLAAGQLRHEPHGHPVGAVPGAHERRAADRAPRRPPRRRRRADQGHGLPRRDRGRRAAPPDRARSPTPSSWIPRRGACCLVDHAEEAQSVAGVGQAEIVEILDHHHIGSIETKVPVTATFDPVGSTATLVIERFRQNGHGAQPVDGDHAARRRALRHGHPQLAHHDRARPRDRRVPGARAGRRRDRVRARDVRWRRPTSRAWTPTRSCAATPRSTRSARARRSASRRSRPSGTRSSSATTSCSRRSRACARPRATFCARSWSPTSSARARRCWWPATTRRSSASSPRRWTTACSTCPA